MKLEVKNQIRCINIADIAPHPDNPRKDLGDLTELADSIRAKGILENLVVIRNPGNLKRIAFPEGGSAELWGDDEPQYRVVIGHRRLAAAKLAGLEMVPCVLQEMTRDEAIAAMLTENGQRTALTPYEEALGFRQLSLDMGKSVSQIRDMTGFGETTIRSRLKLAELDGDKVREGLERGATLDDFAELDKIKDPRLRAEVLEKAGTRNFQNELKAAQQKERRQETLDRWAAEADAFAERVEAFDYKSMEFVRGYSALNKQQSVERPEDAGEKAYYYAVVYPFVELYREKTVEDGAARATKAAAQQARKARIDAFGELTERHFSLRKDFVSGCGVKRAAWPLVMRYAAEVLIGGNRTRYGEFNLSLLAELLGLEVDTSNATWEEVRAAALESAEGRLLLCAAYARVDKLNNGYYALEWNQATGVTEVRHKENPGLDSLYNLLT
ncbi:MAG: ParB N-terminal domain-containing protein, partial [Oscillibacter sp.]|nr:ParB N-terminal domain-containing protein [Oscillibacter sp.]